MAFLAPMASAMFDCLSGIESWSHFFIRAEGTPGMAGFILVFAGMC